jgi:hypothetical protein
MEKESIGEAVKGKIAAEVLVEKESFQRGLAERVAAKQSVEKKNIGRRVLVVVVQ